MVDKLIELLVGRIKDDPIVVGVLLLAIGCYALKATYIELQLRHRTRLELWEKLMGNELLSGDVKAAMKEAVESAVYEQATGVSSASRQLRHAIHDALQRLPQLTYQRMREARAFLRVDKNSGALYVEIEWSDTWVAIGSVVAGAAFLVLGSSLAVGGLQLFANDRVGAGLGVIVYSLGVLFFAIVCMFGAFRYQAAKGLGKALGFDDRRVAPAGTPPERSVSSETVGPTSRLASNENENA